jgi:hypothetical protein
VGKRELLQNRGIDFLGGCGGPAALLRPGGHRQAMQQTENPNGKDKVDLEHTQFSFPNG